MKRYETLKRITTLVCLISFILPVLFVTVFAVSPDAELKISTNEIKAGETVTVTVSINDCKANSLGIIPSYDENAFELVSGEWLLADGDLTDFSDGCAVIAYMSEKDFTGDVFRFVLRAKSGAGGEMKITCDVSAEGMEMIRPEVSVTVAANQVLKGDIDGDGDIDASDLTLLARIVAKIDSLNDSVKAASDVNGDGEINAEDLTMLARIVAKIE